MTKESEPNRIGNEFLMTPYEKFRHETTTLNFGEIRSKYISLGYETNEIERIVGNRMKDNLWEQILPKVMVTISDPKHPNYCHLGYAFGFSMGRVTVMFGCKFWEEIEEEKVLVLPKDSICPSAGVWAEFLDREGNVEKEVQVVAYEKEAGRPDLLGYFNFYEEIDSRPNVTKYPDCGIWKHDNLRFVLKPAEAQI